MHKVCLNILINNSQIEEFKNLALSLNSALFWSWAEYNYNMWGINLTLFIFYLFLRATKMITGNFRTAARLWHWHTKKEDDATARRISTNLSTNYRINWLIDANWTRTNTTNARALCNLFIFTMKKKMYKQQCAQERNGNDAELFVLFFCSRNSSSSCFSFSFFFFCFIFIFFFFLLHFQLDTTNWLRFAHRTKTRLHAATFLKRKFAQAQAATPALALPLPLTLTLTPSLLTIQNLQVAVAAKRTKRIVKRASCGGSKEREKAARRGRALVVLSPLASLLVSRSCACSCSGSSCV